MKTHYPNNDINSAGQNKYHTNQLTPKANQDNTLVSRHTIGGAGSQMSTLHNNMISNDLIFANAHNSQT